MCLFAFSARFFGVSAAWVAMPAGGAPPALHFVQRTSWEGACGGGGQAYWRLRRSSRERRLWELKGLV
jgi:hypothetical protein